MQNELPLEETLAGATAIVAGSAIFGSNDYTAAIAAIREACDP